MKIIHFPKNILSATLEKWFNGHVSAACQNTDTVQANKYELAELEAFRSNIQLTAFADPIASDKTAYDKMLSTGRVSGGDYFQTDRWYNPVTMAIELIPDYYATAWTVSGVNAFGVTLGEAKLARTPNHGQEMFDISAGQYGYDVVNEISGLSNLEEFAELVSWHRSYMGSNSCLSWRNGRSEADKIIIPYYIGGRNSVYSYSGDSNVSYPIFSRSVDVNRDGSTRTWDSKTLLGSLSNSINYTKTQIQRSINSGGFWNDFHHWHNSYNSGTYTDFYNMFSGFSAQIGSQDVWRCGYGQAVEYAYIRELIDLVGSFERGGELYLYYRLKDKFDGTFTSGINNNIDETLFNTPVSIKLSTIGTAIEGKDIICEKATLIRKIDITTWIVSVPLVKKEDGEIVSFKIKEGSGAYYYSTKPIITRNTNTFTSNIPAKWVVWRKLTTDGLDMVREVERDNVLKTSFTHTIESGYNYYIGAISKYGHSSLIEI